MNSQVSKGMIQLMRRQSVAFEAWYRTVEAMKPYLPPIRNISGNVLEWDTMDGCPDSVLLDKSIPSEPTTMSFTCDLPEGLYLDVRVVYLRKPRWSMHGASIRISSKDAPPCIQEAITKLNEADRCMAFTLEPKDGAWTPEDAFAQYGPTCGEFCVRMLPLAFLAMMEAAAKQT